MTPLVPSGWKIPPLNERHYGQLVTLIPGANLGVLDQTTILTSDLMGTNFANVNGNRADSNQYSVDGGYNLDSGSNVSAFDNVGIDFIQEVDVQASNYSADYGRMAGSQVNVVTKSGTNQFHGGAFEYVRNQIFDAANAATELSNPGAPSPVIKPPLHYNDWGWDLGGPLKREKLFFFAGEEWKRLRIAQAQTSLTVPTAAELGGDFRQTAGHYAHGAGKSALPASLTTGRRSAPVVSLPTARPSPRCTA